MLYSGDDESYMAHATSIAYFQFPSYANEYFTSGEGIPLHSIGSSLLASPFVFLFSLVDRAVGNDIVIKRTFSNVSKSWTAFGFTLASIFFLWVACLFLYKGLVLYFEPRISALTVILAVISQGIPLYAFRRPVFSHIYEIFLQSFFIFLLLRQLKFGGYIFANKLSRGIGESALVGLAAGLVILVRFNNIPVALAWPVALFSLYYPGVSKIVVFKKIIISYLFMAVPVLLFHLWPIFYNFNVFFQHKGYFSATFLNSRLFVLYGPVFYLKRLVHLLWGIDWGLLFTAPYLLLGLFSMIWARKDRICRFCLWLLVPIAANLYLTLVHQQQGCWYGYRLLIFSLIPVVAYPLAKFISSAEKKGPFFYYAIILIAVVPVLSMISFESNNGNLTLRVIEQGSGISAWGNNSYQMEIYKTILTDPVQYSVGILKGGPLYLVYLTALALGAKQYLPGIVLEKYSIFQFSTLIKMAIVYSFPFLLLLIYNKIHGRKKVR
jgi:hypothetical protein